MGFIIKTLNNFSLYHALQDIRPETAVDDLKDAKARLKGFAKKKVLVKKVWCLV